MLDETLLADVNQREMGFFPEPYNVLWKSISRMTSFAAIDPFLDKSRLELRDPHICLVGFSALLDRKSPNPSSLTVSGFSSLEDAENVVVVPHV